MVRNYLRVLSIAIVALCSANDVFAADEELKSETYNVFVAKFYFTEVGSSNLLSEKESLKRIQDQIDQQSEVGELKLNELSQVRVFPESYTVMIRATPEQHRLFLKHICTAETKTPQINCSSFILSAPADSLKMLLKSYDFQYEANDNHLYAYAKTRATKEEIEKQVESWNDKRVQIITRPRIRTVDNQLAEIQICLGSHMIGVELEPQVLNATNDLQVELGMFEAVSLETGPNSEALKMTTTIKKGETLVLIDLRPTSLVPDSKPSIKMMFLTPEVIKADFETDVKGQWSGLIVPNRSLE